MSWYTLRRAFELLRHEGVFSLWCKVLAMLGYRRVLLVGVSLEAPISAVTTGVPVAITRLAPAEVDDYLAFRPEVDIAEVRHRLDAGQQCFVARHDGKIVHANWVATGRVRIEFLGRDLDLAPDEIYQDGSHTSPRFRGHNIAAARSAYVQRDYREAGYRRSLSVVFPESRPACRAVWKLGYHPLATIGYVKLGPWRRDFYRPHAPVTSWPGAERPAPIRVPTPPQ